MYDFIFAKKDYREIHQILRVVLFSRLRFLKFVSSFSSLQIFYTTTLVIGRCFPPEASHKAELTAVCI